MNQSITHSDGSPTFTIKVHKTDKGKFTASAPLLDVPPVTADSAAMATATLKRTIDIAVATGKIKHG